MAGPLSANSTGYAFVASYRHHCTAINTKKRSAGVDAFMEKPLNIPILVRAIKHLTSEDEHRHVRRITDPRSSRDLLDNNDS